MPTEPAPAAPAAPAQPPTARPGRPSARFSGGTVAAMSTLLAGGLLLGLAELPAWAATPVAATLVAIPVLRTARRRPAGAPSATLLLAAGFTLVCLVLSGVVLNALRIPLQAAFWGPALALAGIGVVAWAGRNGASSAGSGPPPGIDRTALTALLRNRLTWWSAAALVVAAAAVAVSVLTPPRDAAPLQLALADPAQAHTHDTVLPVSITAVTDAGQLQLSVETPAGDLLDGPHPVRVPAGSEQVVDVRVPASGRALITLRNLDQHTPLRTLILDR